MTDHDIIHALYVQVVSAMPAGRSEVAVQTVISRPLWRRFMAAVGCHPDSEPTPWLGCSLKTRRVWGSETIVVESEHEFSYSRAK